MDHYILLYIFFLLKDYLEIRKQGPIGPLIGVYCENSPNNIIVDSEVWIKFRSDNDTERGAGFVANYKMGK